ncbi:hypothetical protein Tco_0086050 [Tanacetum coccineum]
MSLADHQDVIRAFCLFVGIKTYGWLCHLRLIEVIGTRQRSGNTFVGTPCCCHLLVLDYDAINDFIDMLKQRKMAHITVIGPLLGIVQAQVKSFLKEGSAEGILGMLTSFKGLFGDNESPIYSKLQYSKRDMFTWTKVKDRDIGRDEQKEMDQFEGKRGSLAGVKTRAESASNDIAAYSFSCVFCYCCVLVSLS